MIRRLGIFQFSLAKTRDMCFGMCTPIAIGVELLVTFGSSQK